MALDDIAVVGIGLRFPGDATTPERLWTVLERGESQWSEFPADRLNIDGYFHPSGDRQGSVGSARLTSSPWLLTGRARFLSEERISSATTSRRLMPL
jgi:hypothetical protein